MGNNETGQVAAQEPQAQETVDYSQKALENVNTLIGKVDFSIFMTLLVAVIGATLGVTVGMTAFKKGVAWLKRGIRHAG